MTGAIAKRRLGLRPETLRDLSLSDIRDVHASGNGCTGQGCTGVMCTGRGCSGNYCSGGCNTRQVKCSGGYC